MIRLALRVQRAQAELVLAELLELAPAGVEEVPVDERVVEYAVYGAPGELPSLPDLNAAAGGALVEVSTTEVPDDWHERWREFHKPVLIEPPRSNPGEPALPALRIRPPWEPALTSAPRRLQEIVIDPAQAFGTGAHDSTRLCLELLLELAGERPGGALLDLGTGSGVLAIAAGRLGFQPLLALDNDHESVSAARANALANGVEVEVRRFDLRSETLPWMLPGERPERPLTVSANLLRPLLLELACTLPAAPRQLIAGGLLREEADEIAGVFAASTACAERERRERGGWAALWLSAGPRL